MTTYDGYQARIVADSKSSSAPRLTTMLVTFPRQVLAEFNTHRVFSRNSASSRAIPVVKQLEMVWERPFLPSREQVGRNKSGMQASELLGEGEYEAFLAQKKIQLHRVIVGVFEDLMGLNQVVDVLGVKGYERVLLSGLEEEDFRGLLGCYRGVMGGESGSIPNPHKEVVSRYLEPFMWHEVLVTSTEWENFFALRTHPDADPKIRRIAVMMEEVYRSSVPEVLEDGQWHTPLLTPKERGELLRGDDSLLLVSAGRCARLSYLTHEGVRDCLKDVALATRLEEHGHMSPFEHVARPLRSWEKQRGNLVGWKQLRSTYAFEGDFSQKLASR